MTKEQIELAESVLNWEEKVWYGRKVHQIVFGCDVLEENDGRAIKDFANLAHREQGLIALMKRNDPARKDNP